MRDTEHLRLINPVTCQTKATAMEPYLIDKVNCTEFLIMLSALIEVSETGTW